MCETRTVLVTGAASGIGRATAERFAADGWRVVAGDVDGSGLAGLDRTAGVETTALDVTDEGRVETVVDRVGPVDCLVNAAGFAAVGPVEDVPGAALRESLAVLVEGPATLVRATLPGLRDRGGAVVNVTSVLGRVAFPGFGAYCAGKAGLEALTDALRTETGPAVDVVAVQPSWVDTGFAPTARERLADRERTGVNDATYRVLAGWALDGGPLAVAPERVAETVHRAATADDPQARYPVGRLARTIRAARHLPAPVADPLRWAVGRASAALARV
ncbi:MAG: SDR family NAD(P)-dependent oxidoreductase [Halorhabdus sp.]